MQQHCMFFNNVVQCSAKRRLERWRSNVLAAAQVLILDEISMISAEMFNALEQMARDLKGSEEPFGGIQLILAGDFFQ